MLIVAGSLGSLVAMADPSRAGLLPLTLAMLFSGAGVYLFGFGVAYLGERVLGSTDIPFFVGLLVGSLGGAILGLVIGIRRNLRLNHTGKMKTNQASQENGIE